ncbi:MAG: hypothetical protein M5U16_03860 [Hyphomicrobium sp.]|nr:hypothetical protein [Hyphomicrobium sp.]
MRVRVETYAGYGGVEMPSRIFFDERCIEVAENLDQWHGPDYRYFKLKGDDDSLYILRLDESRAEWDLTLFQRPHTEDGATLTSVGKRSPMSSA